MSHFAHPPPLPLGWTEYPGPNGVPYYFNAHTQESTYTRPIPIVAAPKVKEKERPITKLAIPGTEWLRVKTSAGNVFYSHKPTKKSVWTVPDEIKDAVDALEKTEGKGVSEDKGSKRKAEEPTAGPATTKKVKVDAGELENEASEDKQDEGKSDESEEEEDEDEEEEEWQKEAAATLAAEAEEERKRVEEEEKRLKEQEEKMQLNMPQHVDLSLDEAKALFKTLLREKDINPLHPWDTSLPLFISDPRYVLLPSVTARRETFDQYCRERIREQRQAKSANKDTVKEPVDSKQEFDRLLRDEVKSTRMTWSEFKRVWKKNRAFYGWGRDDREREKRFKEYLKELGEKKKAAAQRAESDFFALLKEYDLAKSAAPWKEVKSKLHKDPRYDAVGSSSLREELYNTFLKASDDPKKAPPQNSISAEHGQKSNNKNQEPKHAQSRAERKERAVKEREERVKAERAKVESDIGRSRHELEKEEGELSFRALLTDAVRDPQMTWDTALPHLTTDPRFTRSPLPQGQQRNLFQGHVAQLRSKHFAVLHNAFTTLAPSLAISSWPGSRTDSHNGRNEEEKEEEREKDEEWWAVIEKNGAGKKLGLSKEQVEAEFSRWHRERLATARSAFSEMLTENAFVEFWGRLGKIGGEGVEGGVKADESDMPEDEGEGGGGKVDMKALAKNVDVEEMEKVLRNDKRYIVFEHIPEQRVQWIRDYVAQQAASSLSVHVPK